MFCGALLAYNMSPLGKFGTRKAQQNSPSCTHGILLRKGERPLFYGGGNGRRSILVAQAEAMHGALRFGLQEADCGQAAVCLARGHQLLGVDRLKVLGRDL